MKQYRLRKKKESIINSYIDDIYLAAEYTYTSTINSESELSIILDKRPLVKFKNCTDRIIKKLKKQ